MQSGKQRILGLQEEFLSLLGRGGLFSTHVRSVKVRLGEVIEEAKARNDGMVQLYCCLVEAYLDTFMGGKEELLQLIEGITKTDKQFILAHEKGAAYPSTTLQLDADTYGFYYAINDHYAQLWNKRDYALSKNGAEGNPLITHLISLLYTNEDGEPVIQMDEYGRTERSPSHWENPVRSALLKAMTKHQTKIFGDTRLAFVGGAGLAYERLITPFSGQFSHKGFMNFSPYHNGPELSLEVAQRIVEREQVLADYVVSSNVLNSFDHHIDHSHRDEVFAAAAKILKKGGKAIHLMEKTSQQSHFNVNLSRTMHKAIGQDLVYSFYRDKETLDRELDKQAKAIQDERFNTSEADLDIVTLGPKDAHTEHAIKAIFLDHLHQQHSDTMARKERIIDESRLDGKGDDFRTSMLVMYQSGKPLITEKTVAKTKEKLNHYQNRFNYHHVPVYVEKPGVGIE